MSLALLSHWPAEMPYRWLLFLNSCTLMQLFLISVYHTGSLCANWHLIVLLFTHALALDKAISILYSDIILTRSSLWRQPTRSPSSCAWGISHRDAGARKRVQPIGDHVCIAAAGRAKYLSRAHFHPGC